MIRYAKPMSDAALEIYRNGRSVELRRKQAQWAASAVRLELDILEGKQPMPDGVTETDVRGTLRINLNVLRQYCQFLQPEGYGEMCDARR